MLGWIVADVLRLVPASTVGADTSGIALSLSWQPKSTDRSVAVLAPGVPQVTGDALLPRCRSLLACADQEAGAARPMRRRPVTHA
jgi:hypothetical protein